MEAFRQGDLGTVASLIAEDAVWHVPGDHPLTGEYVGRERVFEFLTSLPPLGFTIREHDVFANDEHLCALSFIGARREGLEVETRVVSVFHFRDGQQTERWFYPEDPATWNRVSAADRARTLRRCSMGIDHLVIAVTRTRRGRHESSRSVGSGSVPGGGGRHDALGTFNRLVWLGDTYSS